MTALSPALDNALAGPTPTVFGAVRIDLPTATIAVLDGAGILAFGGQTYTGRDETYGVLSAIDNLTDGTGDQAPAVSITFLPASDAAAVDLASPTQQGSLVTITAGAVDPATGGVIGTHQMGLYELDVPTLGSRANERSLELECVSVFQRFFTDDEGIRLSPDWHRSVWPAEAGLDDVTGVSQTINWGVAGPNAGVYVYKGTTGLSGGGYYAAL